MINVLDNSSAAPTLHKTRRPRASKYIVPAIVPISNRKVVIVKYQLFHRISFAKGFVARISSLPVSMHKFK
jgi:hypothetical protein